MAAPAVTLTALRAALAVRVAVRAAMVTARVAARLPRRTATLAAQGCQGDSPAATQDSRATFERLLQLSLLFSYCSARPPLGLWLCDHAPHRDARADWHPLPAQAAARAVPPAPAPEQLWADGGRLGDGPASLLVGERAAAGRHRDAGVRHAHRLAVRPAAFEPLLGRRPVVERAAAATLPAAAATNGAPCPQRDEHDGGPAADLWHAARQALPFRTTVPTASHTLPMPSSC